MDFIAIFTRVHPGLFSRSLWA